MINRTSINRRKALKSTGLIIASGLAGCSGTDDGPSDGSDGGGDGSDGGGSTVSDGGDGPTELPSYENEVGQPVGETWEAIQELAKEEEGDVVNYSSQDQEEIDIWFAEFDRNWGVEHQTGSGGQLAQRGIQEYRGGNPTMDMSTSSSAVFVLEPEGLAVNQAELELPNVDELDDQWKTDYFPTHRTKVGGIYYNTDMVDDPPSDFADLVENNQWSDGNLGWDPTPHLGLMGSLHERHGREFFENLASQEPDWVDSHSSLVEFTGAGRFPVAFSYADILHRYEEAPVELNDDIELPVAGAGAGVTAFSNRPNRTLIMVNYLSSNMGQQQVAETHSTLEHGIKTMPRSQDWEYFNPTTAQSKIDEARELWHDDLELGP